MLQESGNHLGAEQLKRSSIIKVTEEAVYLYKACSAKTLFVGEGPTEGHCNVDLTSLIVVAVELT